MLHIRETQNKSFQGEQILSFELYDPGKAMAASRWHTELTVICDQIVWTRQQTLPFHLISFHNSFICPIVSRDFLPKLLS